MLRAASLEVMPSRSSDGVRRTALLTGQLSTVHFCVGDRRHPLPFVLSLLFVFVGWLLTLGTRPGETTVRGILLVMRVSVFNRNNYGNRCLCYWRFCTVFWEIFTVDKFS